MLLVVAYQYRVIREVEIKTVELHPSSRNAQKVFGPPETRKCGDANWIEDWQSQL